MTETFKPNYFEITAISQVGQNTRITTDGNHNFVLGNTVFFQIPQEYNMNELDGKKGNVIAIASTTLDVDINSSNFTPFSVPSPAVQLALVVGLGSTNYNKSTDVNGVSGAFRVITS